jgi:hypothetical protein
MACVVSYLLALNLRPLPVQAAGRQALLEQLQQGMAGFSWEPQDWEWRPTWTPSMRQGASSSSNGCSKPCAATIEEQEPCALPAGVDGDHSASAEQPTSTATPTDRLLSAVAATVSDTSQQQQQVLLLLAGITLQLAELEAPKRGIAFSTDEPLLRFYKQSLQAAVSEKGPDVRVLVLSNGGGGVLALLAAAAGAGSVVVVEKGRWGFRAAQQLLEANEQQQAELVSKVQLVPVPLSKCWYKASGGIGNSEGAGATGDAAAGTMADGPAQHMCGNNCVTAECDAVVHVVGAQHLLRPWQGAPAGIQTAAGAAAGADDCFYLEHQADIVVTDLLDYRWAAAVEASLTLDCGRPFGCSAARQLCGHCQ